MNLSILVKIVIVSIIVFALALTCLGQNMMNDKTDCTAYIASASDNGSHIEYPQIEGIKNPELKQKINNLLKEEVIKGPKDASNQNFVDFSDPQSLYNYTSGVGFLNQSIGSFWYSCTCDNQKFGWQGSIYRYFCITALSFGGKLKPQSGTLGMTGDYNVYEIPFTLDHGYGFGYIPGNTSWHQCVMIDMQSGEVVFLDDSVRLNKELGKGEVW